MSVKIVVDSSADLTSQTISGIPIQNVPFSLIIDHHSWTDNDNINLAKLVKAIKETKQKSTSSCPNVGDWQQAFDGADEIFVITIASGLSGSYNSAFQAASIYSSSHPSVKIKVFDSLGVGAQMQLVVYKLIDLIKQGIDFDRISFLTEKYISKTKLIFSLKTVENLAINGRASLTLAKLAQLLHVYVVGEASDDAGKFQALQKVRTAKRSQQALLQQMINMGYSGGLIRINHVQDVEAAKSFKKLILSHFPDASVTVGTCRGLCSFYAEPGALMVGFEKES